MAKRYRLTAEEFGGLTVAVHCDVEFDRSRRQWKATSDLGHVAYADFGVRAALECFAMRLGITELEREIT